MKPLIDELTTLLNGYSEENESNTPDFMLAKFMLSCLEAFNVATRERDRWYGVHLEPGNKYFKGQEPQPTPIVISARGSIKLGVTQERAAALYRALGDGCDLSAPEQEKRDIEAITDALTDTRRAALLEVAKLVGDYNCMHNHGKMATKACDDIFDALDRLASEGA